MSSLKILFLTLILLGNLSGLFAQKKFYTCHDVSVDEFHAWHQAKIQIVIYDVRNNEAYQNKHIPRAISAASDSALISLCDTLDADQKIIVYDEFDNESIDACLLLASKGKSEIYHLKGGFQDWEKLGFRVETSKKRNK